ncbi:lipocalin-like domain-containing protein [Enterobacter cloacae]|uniref:lipocalin-like domain-containing protein n=1 Tax=Enterobacter cloacae TaxID=550 RepID=UPI0021D117DB|nr:lipocalin-like domain-containing protein [Enterobacter cloacae]MCU6209267.1 lipocalin-like domain-containing protein [Enterobacter cloacae]
MSRFHSGTFCNSGWVLQRYSTRSPDSNLIVYPLGSQPAGMLIYGEEKMSVMICKHPLNDGSQPISSFPDEVPPGIPGVDYLFYTGAYECDVDNEIVTHHLESCCIPEWIDTRQQRHISLYGNFLQLQTVTPVILEGQEQHASLVWKRLF